MSEQISNNTSANNKRIAKNTVFLYIRMLFTMAVSLYTSRVVLNTLGVDDYGIYNVVGGVVSLTTFLNGMMTAATQRFLNIEIGKDVYDRITKAFSTAVQIHIGISLVVLILAETIGVWFLNNKMNIPVSRLNAANWVFQFSLLSCLVVILSAPYNAAIIAYEKMSAFAYISVLEVSLKLIIVYLLVISSVDKLILYSILLFTVQILIRVIYGNYVSRNFIACRFKFIDDRKLLKEMLSFASWSFMGIISGIGFTQGISIILNLFFGVTVNAARGITIQIQGAIQGFITNFQVAVNPQLYKSYATRDYDRMKSLIYLSSRFSFYLMLLLSLPVFVNTDFILSLWLGIVPDHTANFVRLILIIMLFETLTSPIIVSVNATGHIKKCQVIVGGLLLSILPLSYLAFKLGASPEIAYLIHFFIVIIAQIARVIILRPWINLSIKDYFRKVICNTLLVLITASVIPLVLKYFFITNNTFLHFFELCFVCVLSIVFTIFLIGLSHNERLMLRKKIILVTKRFI
nr:lipopolysaccharide biosynthesis protein [uncultured Bacteroides sp.]